ncbi:MAG: hypothetical protein ACI8RD_009213, partial [Bacillariaceae sp.]
EDKNILKKWQFKSPFDSDNNKSNISNNHGTSLPPPTNFSMAIPFPANNNKKPSSSTSSGVDDENIIIDDVTSFISSSTTVSSFILPSNNSPFESSDNNNNNNNNNNHYKSISTAKYKYYKQQQKRNSSNNPRTIRTPALLGFFWKTHPLLTTVIDNDNDNDNYNYNYNYNDNYNDNYNKSEVAQCQHIGEQKETKSSSSIISTAENEVFYRHQEESLTKEDENDEDVNDNDNNDTEKVPNRKEFSPYLHPSVVRKIWMDSQPFQLDALYQ